MLKNILNLIFTDTGKDTTVVAVGTLVNAIAGGLFFILVPRMLGPAQYGLFATTVALSVFAVNLANLGIDTGILKFLQKNKISQDIVLSLAFKSYLILGITIGLLGIIFSQMLANFLNQPQLSPFFKIAFASTILLLLTNFYTAALQAKKKFVEASLITVLSNIARLAVLLMGALLFTVSLNFVTVLFFLVNILSIIAGKLLVSFNFEKVNKKISKEFFGFNFWVWVSLLITSIPYDNFFLLKMAGPIQTGLYFAPFKFFSIAYQFGSNFSKVIAPRYTSFDTTLKVKQFTQKTIPLVLIFILSTLALIPFSKIIIQTFFGQDFAGSISIFKLLALAFSFFFASLIPSSIILYYLGDSKTSFYITFFKVIVFLIFLLFLIPRFAGLGAAASYMFSEFVFFIVICAFVLYKLQK